ncbi:MAG: shikimate kinase [Phycisphaeraceae bacterium]
MNIILIGYRGCGKTTLGRQLADHLWKTFVDVDREICRRFDNLTIAKIWAAHGEPRFREVETQVTAEACAKDEQVIALGGGTLMQPKSRAAVEQSKAVRIYLKCNAEELLKRIEGDPDTAGTRPNLTPHQGGLEEIKAMLAVREPVYLAVADKVFDVTHLPPADALSHLIRRCL